MKNSSKAKETTRKYFTLWDLTVLSVVLISCLCCAFFVANPFVDEKSETLRVVISVNGVEQDTIDLSNVSEPYKYTIDGEVPVTLSISSAGVCFLHSECPDKLCINTGLLSKTSQSAVCLPARVSVKLISDLSEQENTPDAVVG